LAFLAFAALAFLAFAGSTRPRVRQLGPELEFAPQSIPQVKSTTPLHRHNAGKNALQFPPLDHIGSTPDCKANFLATIYHR
jgi:hypothetical protein